MRRVAEPDRIQRFMTALAVKATRPARLSFPVVPRLCYWDRATTRSR